MGPLALQTRVVAAFLLLTLTARTAAGQAPAAWFGTWKLNLEKSKYVPGPPPYRRASYTIEPLGDQLKVIYDLVYPRGGVSHMEWIGKLDGQDYPMQGVEEAITYAYRPLNAGAYEVVVKVDGHPVAVSTVSISADGKTMTTTTEGTIARGQKLTTITVYEKQ